MTLQGTLSALFDAERNVRDRHVELLDAPRAQLVDALRAVVKDAAGLAPDEASLRLTRAASLLGDLEGPEAVDLLIDILGSDSSEARVTAGEALEGLAFDRFKEVALGIERALDRLPKGSPALTELPYLLAEVGEPGCVKVLGRFLQHPDAEAVAAAIEAMAELGDPAAVPLLAPLEKDARQVQLDEEDGESERVAIGDLAHEARELLSELGESTQEAFAQALGKGGGGGGGRGGPPPGQGQGRGGPGGKARR
jgi:HEAT repeat protein